MATLSAHELYQSVAAIDDCLKVGRRPEPELMQTANSQLAALRAEIAALVVNTGPVAAAPPLAPTELAQVAKDLEQALRYDLGAAQPLLDRLMRGTAGTGLMEQVSTLSQCVDRFEIDQALGLLAEIERDARVTQP